MKVFHATGSVERKNSFRDDDFVREVLSFSHIFGSLEQAREFLIECFKYDVDKIYKKDEVFSDSRSPNGLYGEPEGWQEEYIGEHISYELEVEEFDPSELAEWHKRNRKPSDYKLDDPSGIEWIFNHHGKVVGRRLCYDKKTYFFREGDYLQTAGTKFKVGDIVENKEESLWSDDVLIYIVSEVPKNKNKRNKPWENVYKLWTVDGLRLKGNFYRYIRKGDYSLCTYNEFHEEDLMLVDDSKIPEDCSLRLLQKIAKGELVVSKEIWDDLCGGRIVLNDYPSWRDIEVLNPKRKQNDKC